MSHERGSSPKMDLLIKGETSLTFQLDSFNFLTLHPLAVYWTFSSRYQHPEIDLGLIWEGISPSRAVDENMIILVYSWPYRICPRYGIAIWQSSIPQLSFVLELYTSSNVRVRCNFPALIRTLLRLHSRVDSRICNAH